MRISMLLMCAGLLIAPAVPSAGVVRGTVSVPASAAQPTHAANPYPGHANALPSAHPVPRGLVTDAVVYVDHMPSSAASSLARTADPPPQLSQRDQTFVPRVVVVAAGTRVDFPNLDPIYHNVFSLSPAKRFDLGKYPRGHSRQVTFTKPGLVNVYCDIHSDMEAFVLVLPHSGFTRPRASGAYALPDVPAGHYTVTVWHPDLGTQACEVDVPEHGDVTADFRF